MTDIVSDLLSGSPAITDDLNYADGTTLTGQTLSNGDVWQCVGPTNPVVTGRIITNSGNTYPGFPNVTAAGGTPQPVKAFGAAVRFLNNGLSGTLIAENWAAGPITTMIHYNFGAQGWGLSVMLSGVFQSTTWSGVYQCAQNEWRHAWMEINGNTVTLHHADGTSTAITHTLFGTVAPTGVRFQLCVGTNTIEYGIPWCGGMRAPQIRALGDGATSQQVARLETFVAGNVPPTSKTLADATWTNIAQIEVVPGAGVTVFEVDAMADLGSYAVGYAYSGVKVYVPVTGYSGGSVFNTVYAPGSPYQDIWAPGSAGVQLYVQGVHTSGTTIMLQAKATQYNTGTGTHPIVWEAHKRGERSATITPL